MVGIPGGALIVFLSISLYFMLCEYPLVSLSVVYHCVSEPVLKALRTTIPEVRVEMIIRCFFL